MNDQNGYDRSYSHALLQQQQDCRRSCSLYAIPRKATWSFDWIQSDCFESQYFP